MKTLILPRSLLAACCAAALLTACPGDDPVLEPEGTGTSTGDTPTTLPMTTTIDPATSVDTTVTPEDTSTTGDPDTTGSTSASTDTGSTSASTDTGSTGASTDTGSTGASTDTGSTGASTDTGSTGSTGSTGESSSTGGGMNMEGFAECSIDDTMCLPEEDCVVDDPVAPTITVCTDLSCNDATECPAAPPGGTAPVTCNDVTGDMIGDCFLDCSAGQTCPTGMDCFADFLCAWSIAPPPPPEGFAECSIDDTMCLAEEDCVVDDPVAPTITVCTDLDCADATECPAAPPGGTAPVTCSDVTGDMIDDCFLDCSAGQTCPTGMDCFADFLCAWSIAPPPPPEGYADCEADPTVCLAEELCVVDDPVAPTISVCADLDCGAPADCPASPPGGTAPVECADITGDMVGDCFLDCSAGQSCPTGMTCFASFLCAWQV